MPSKLFELPAGVQWVDKNGRPTRIFVEWMRRLWERAGGSSAMSVDALSALSSAPVASDTKAKDAADLATALALAIGSHDKTVSTQAASEYLMLVQQSAKIAELQEQVNMLQVHLAAMSNTKAEMQPEDVLAITVAANGARKIRYASGWNDYLMPANSFALGASAPTLTNFRDGIRGLAFAGTGASVNLVHGNAHYLHDVIRGAEAPVYFHIHTSHIIAAPGSTNYVFNIEHSTARREQAFPASTNFDLICATRAQYVHAVDEASTAQAITDHEVDALTLLTVSRDPAHASDDFAQDVYLWQVDAHYLSTTPGLTDDRTPDANGFFTRRSY